MSPMSIGLSSEDLNKEASFVFRSLEETCQRLEHWGKKINESAFEVSICELVQVCRSTIKCSQPYLTTAQDTACESPLTVEELLSRTTLNQRAHYDTAGLHALLDECRKRIAEAISLIDRIATQKREEQPWHPFAVEQDFGDHIPKTSATSTNQRWQQLDILYNSFSTFTKGSAGKLGNGATPYTKTKTAWLRDKVESRLLPEFMALVADLSMAQKPQDSKNGEPSFRKLPEDPSLSSNEDRMRNRRIEVRYDTCMEFTSDLAKRLPTLIDPLYIHKFMHIDQFPCVEVPGVPTAEGSYGLVSKATNPRTGAVVAIKQLRKLYSDKKRNAVLKELGMLERCDHPNIIRLLVAYQLEDDPSIIYLVTEPWAPYTLDSFLHEGDSRRQAACPWFVQGSADTEGQILKIFKGLAAGLEYLHDNSIKHKDIKPPNILLHNPSGDNLRPIIADLGISKIFQVGGSTDYNQSTYTYLAPEQIASIESSLKADIWQMGCCFALTLTVFHAGSAGCRQLWNSFENTNEDCSCNIAKESIPFMKTLNNLCGSGTPSQFQVYRLITTMLDINPASRPDVGKIRRELEKLN